MVDFLSLLPRETSFVTFFWLSLNETLSERYATQILKECSPEEPVPYFWSRSIGTSEAETLLTELPPLQLYTLPMKQMKVQKWL